MRRTFLAAALLLSACASGQTTAAPPMSVTSAGVWAYAFDAGPGIASATLTGADGRLVLRLTCQAPRGDLEVTDWAFSRTRQGDVSATVSVAGQPKTVAGRVAGDGAGRQALTLTLPARDPMWNALTPSAPVRTEAAGFTHVWAPEAASRINDVLNSCRSLGS
jgi:hypothetical protein